MFYVEVSGSPYEMGYQFGRATRLAIASTIDFLAKSFRHWDDARFEQARERHMAYTERLRPELIEEVQGIADGSGMSFRWIYLTNFYASLKMPIEGCTNVIFADTPDGPLLAKTNDLPVHEGKHTGLCLRRPTDGPAVLSLTFPGTTWQGAGINEHGLAVGGSSCSATLPMPHDVMNTHSVLGYVLRRCETVADAIKLIDSINVGKGANYALADKTGDVAIIEKAANVMGIRRAGEDGRLWCANNALTPELAPHPAASVEQRAESQGRYDAIDRLTRGRTLDADVLREVLAWNGPGALCRYGDNDPVANETEVACIMRPAAGTMECCFSHADRDPWRTFSVADGEITDD